MTDDTLDILRRAEIDGRALAMTKAERFAFLRRKRWSRVSSNIWADRAGVQLPFGAAVREQLRRDMESE